MLIPALEKNQTRLWPFSGPLHQLLASASIILAETYPAEFYAKLGLNLSNPPVKSATKSLTEPSSALPIRFGKRSQAQRALNALQLILQAEKSGVVLSGHLINQLDQGFGTRPTGEDAFDAVVGLLGMVSTLRTWQIRDDPGRWASQSGHWVKIEGWIFGQRFSE